MCAGNQSGAPHSAPRLASKSGALAVRIRYFYLDEFGTVYKAEQRQTEAAVLKAKRWDDSTGTKLLRIVSFICDDDLRPMRGSITSFIIADGFITRESRGKAMAAYQSQRPPITGPPPKELPLIDEQLALWPDERELFPQLTAALDIPIDQMPRLYFGGPLMLAMFLGVSVKQALMYLDLRDDVAGLQE
jgi:hypothetical protein